MTYNLMYNEDNPRTIKIAHKILNKSTAKNYFGICVDTVEAMYDKVGNCFYKRDLFTDEQLHTLYEEEELKRKIIENEE